MHPSHLLRHDMEYHRAALLREAEHTRLARLARSETTSLWQRWLARRYQGNIRLFWRQAALRKQARAVASQRIITPTPEAACCGVCSC